MSRIIIFLALFLLGACGGSSSESVASPPTAPPLAGSGGVNDADKVDRPTVILVSFDGFRFDYQDLYATPAMDRLATEGVRASALLPVFPTLTFPNHYSIATGLDPSNHGIIANTFPSRDRSRTFSLDDPAAVGDGSWYGGEPAWVATEASGMVSAAYYFVGTEAEIAGIRPTFWQRFDSGVPGGDRVAQVLSWLALGDAARPHFITLYFGDVDRVGHQFGPDSAQTAAAVASVDQHLDQLLRGLAQTPVADTVYVVLISDHGMSAQLPNSDVFVLENVVALDGITTVGSGAYAFLFFDVPDTTRATQLTDLINAAWPNGVAYTKDNAPVEWNVTDSSRFPDVIVQANPGYLVVKDASVLTQLPVGFHGWTPDFDDMHGIFIARGPRLAAGRQIGTVAATDVYALLLQILEIPLMTPIDGDTNTLPGLLEN